MAITTTQQSQIYQVTIAMYQAAPGLVYFNELARAMEAGMSIQSIYSVLAKSPSFQNQRFEFGAGATDAQFAAAFVDQLLGSGTVTAAARTEAIAFVQARIAANGGDRGVAMYDTVTRLGLLGTSDPNYGVAVQRFSNRVEVAVDYTQVKGGNSTDIATLQSTIASVTQDPATVSAAKQSNTNTATSGTIFTLSPNADGPGAAAPAVNTSGTAGNDVYNGTIDTTAGAGTLNSSDLLDGKSGADLLNARAVNITADTTVAPTLVSIDQALMSNVTTGGAFYAILNAASADADLKTVGFKDTVAGSESRFINVNTGATIVLDNADGSAIANKAAHEVHLKGADTRTGTSDAFTLQVKNGTGTAGASSTFAFVDAAGATDNTFENANIATSGAASYLGFAAGQAALRVITVTGDAAADTSGYGLSIGSGAGAAAATALGGTALRTIDASGMTGSGGLNIHAAQAGGQTTLKFVGSGKNDRIVTEGTVLNATNTFNFAGGAGTDTIGVATTTDFAAAGSATLRTTINAMTDFEILEMVTAAVTTLKASDFTKINEFKFSGAQTANLAVTGVETGDKFTFMTKNVALAGDMVTFTGAVAGQSMTLELLASTGGQAVLEGDGAGGNGVVFTGGITNVTIQSNVVGSQATANQILADAGVAAIDNTSASTITITGNQALTIGAVAGLATPLGFSTAVSVNAAALTGVLRIAGSADADQIVGGTAADIIYSRGGNDVLTGGGAADQFRIQAAAEGNDKINDFTTGTDKIGILSGFVNFAGTTASAAGQTLAATDYVETRNDITGITAGDTLKVVEIQTSLSTAQITGQVGAAAEAIVLVHNSTTGKAELWHDTDWSDAGTRTQIASLDNVTTLASTLAIGAGDFVEYVV